MLLTVGRVSRQYAKENSNNTSKLYYLWKSKNYGVVKLPLKVTFFQTVNKVNVND